MLPLALFDIHENLNNCYTGNKFVKSSAPFCMLALLANLFWNRIFVKALIFVYFYFSSSLGIVGKTMGTLFSPVPVEIQAYEPERVGGTVPNDLEKFS